VHRPGQVVPGDDDRSAEHRPGAHRGRGQPGGEDDGEQHRDRQPQVLDQADRPAEQPEVGRTQRGQEVPGGHDEHADQRPRAAAQPVPAQPRQQWQDEPGEVGGGQALQQGAVPVGDRRQVGRGAGRQEVPEVGHQERVVDDLGQLLPRGHRAGAQQRQEDQQRHHADADADHDQVHQPAPAPAQQQLDTERGHHDRQPEGPVGVAGGDREEAEGERDEGGEPAAGEPVRGPPEVRDPGERHEPGRPAGRLVPEGEARDRQGDRHDGGRPAGRAVAAGEQEHAHGQQAQELHHDDERGERQVVERRHQQEVEQVDGVPDAGQRLGGVVAAHPAGRVHGRPLPGAQLAAEQVPQRGELLVLVAHVVEELPPPLRDDAERPDQRADTDGDQPLGHPAPPRRGVASLVGDGLGGGHGGRVLVGARRHLPASPGAAPTGAAGRPVSTLRDSR
jgi:hypothetical protein